MMEYTADSDKLTNLFYKYILPCDREVIRYIAN